MPCCLLLLKFEPHKFNFPEHESLAIFDHEKSAPGQLHVGG